MKVLSDIGVHITEDGERFLDEGEAKIHEAFLYIWKTMAAFGHKEVTLVVNDVAVLVPEIGPAIRTIAQQLQKRHAIMPVGPNTPKIDSVNAPANIAATASSSDEPPILLGPSVPLPPAVVVTPSVTTTAEPTPIGELEQSRKPDERPRMPTVTTLTDAVPEVPAYDTSSIGAAAVAGALVAPQSPDPVEEMRKIVDAAAQ
jgi:hypothetical protein